MITQELHDGWTLRAVGGPVPAEIAAVTIPATVPGSAHTDLLAAGLIPDPYLDRNEAGLAWMHRADWRYELHLTAAAPADDERVDLTFDGLDTVATIELDGSDIGHTANQHRSYRFDVRGLLGADEHTLAVHFRSALEYAEAERARLGGRPSAYEHPLNMVRKMACSFGWDWGPDLQTAGIGKAVRLERWRTARIAQVRPLVTVDPHGTGRVAVHVDVERAGLADDDVELVVRASLGGGEVVAQAVVAQAVIAQAVIETGATTVVVHLELPDAPLWWPVGHGSQPLVDLDVTIDQVDAGAGGAPLDEWHRRIGFRTVEIDTRPDEIGAPFTFRINGCPVFAKGANWIPDDHLLTRITHDRIVRRVDQALGANLNLLRVWGGGVYESDDFYDVCDEAGILVWQDFPLACSAYPEEEPLWGELEAEARQNVARLTPHPSLVLWNGGNENLWGFMDWGWQEELAGATWGYRYYTELFPAVVAELDPTRPYVEGSPCSPGEPLDVVHPNDLDHGTHHQWEVWNRVDYTAYRDEIPRFCSEFGFQAPPTWATLERAVRNPDGAPLSKEDPVFLLHQKAEDGNGKLDRGLAPHLGIPGDFADWHWATQLNQARAVAYAIEHYRSWWPRTAGAIVWQLNDCWPVTSWAAIDSDERPKPLWYALRHANADRTITVQRRDDRDVLSIVNDTSEIWHGTVHLSRQLLDGTPLAQCDLQAQVGARSVATIALPDDVRTPGDPTGELLVAELDGIRTVRTWVEDVELRLDPDPLEASVTRFDDGYRVEVRATSLARDVTLLIDRLDPAARVDDALVTLPAGTSATFTVRTTAQLTAAELTGPLVLRTANDLALCRAAARPEVTEQTASVPAASAPAAVGRRQGDEQSRRRTAPGTDDTHG